MARKNEEVTSEEDAKVPAPDEELKALAGDAADIPKAFPFPGDTQTQGTRHPKPGFISAAVAGDLEMYGSAVDPATGKRYTRADFPDESK